MTRASYAVVAVLALGAPACWREERAFREPAAASSRTLDVRQTELQAGPPHAVPSPHGAYDGNAWGISEGQRLFDWYNCSGCHGRGGGGSGPALMDSHWIYGSAPQNVYETIAQGRPNGMPSFGSRVPSQQIWQLVAYVRALGGLQPPDAIAPRADSMAQQSVKVPQ